MDRRDRENIAGVIAVAAIVALGLWLVHLAAANIKLQNCVFSGRRDCAPIPMNDSR